MMKFLSLLLPLCFAQPDWCQWVPLASQQYVPDCSGYVSPTNYGFSCASWCQWVPGPSWGYTPECNSCYQVYSGHYKSMAPPTTVAKTTESGCKASCQWLSKPSWNSTSDCMKCEQPLVLEAKSEETAPSPRLKVKMQWQRPDWCKWVPLGSLQYVGDCTGGGVIGAETGSLGCANWCGWSPVSAWQYIPECGQCSGWEGTEVAPMTGCENWCQWVSRPSWQNVGGCAGCEALATNSNANEIRP
mmetsp:Transcript_29985/g.48426  ORF Transcript_29985/g.48426 Transcript_29985/m.48426 type:complete len:244 (+) Transcript_29985:52-783(+)